MVFLVSIPKQKGRDVTITSVTPHTLDGVSNTVNPGFKRLLCWGNGPSGETKDPWDTNHSLGLLPFPRLDRIDSPTKDLCVPLCNVSPVSDSTHEKSFWGNFFLFEKKKNKGVRWTGSRWQVPQEKRCTVHYLNRCLTRLFCITRDRRTWKQREKWENLLRNGNKELRRESTYIHSIDERYWLRKTS